MPIVSVGNVALEVWDIYGDYFSYRQFVERIQLVEVPWLTQLYIPYTLFFGLACLASVAAILLKLKVFVGFVARMLGQAAVVLDHEQKLADAKKQMIALTSATLQLARSGPQATGTALAGPVGIAKPRPGGPGARTPGSTLSAALASAITTSSQHTRPLVPCYQCGWRGCSGCSSRLLFLESMFID
jgi:hypothetical protein